MPQPENLDKFETLMAILARLRAPDGCPWDRQQTHASLREFLLAECYEALEALDDGSSDKLRDELGDLLLQIVFHAQIAAEAGEFKMDDVIGRINAKLIHRHPHIFGSTKAATAEEVAHNWEELKRQEREKGASILESVPEQMPALGYSQEVQRRVAQVGFDWESLDGVIEKLGEEIEELRKADSQEQKAQEFGDLLFTLVNIARRMGVNSETALREANRKFVRRFACMEKICRKRGVKLGDLSFDEQNRLWDEAKGKVK
ncbi:MAG: nucleoside triphosphate pyrophosphohydrolase [Chloroflexota bacterium]